MGGKKGGGGHTPYEAPDNLKSAQRLSAIGLISLGPIRGAVTADQYQSAFFDYTPIKNSKGEWNYQNTLIRYRLGYQDQQPLEDFDASEREVSVGAEVKLEHPISRTVIDPDIDLLRITLGVNALFSQNNQGDTHGTLVQLEILINGQSRQTVVINGKSSSRFHRSYLIDNLPPRPFTVTVQRVTPDSKSQRLQNATFWSSYTEIISAKLSYPNMAIVGIKTDSRYNPSFPNINFLLYGRLVKVPSNYDPDTRTYGSGLWRGDFKLAWTNNPAWVFYDLVTNKLAGLGQRLGDYGIDKFQLYQIAQYCDQQVPDGYGGQEPRMVANLWLTEQRDAYSVISDMASVFRAIVVWNGTQLTAIQDRNADPVCTFTQANVIDGKFNRQYVPLKSIFTAVEVEYADERNNYQKAIEYVADDAMIKRYGYNVKKIVAFACTSRGQARRYGKWVLETSRLEQCTISFSVGREGLQVLPGDIIEIADKSYANVNLGGRVLAINGRTVTLDAPIEVAGEKYLSYLVNDNNGQRLVRRKISQINAQNKSLVTLDSEPTGLQVMDTWALHTPLVSTQRYRVLGVAENEDGSYGITALQHEPQKERIVDEGAIFTPLSETRHKVEPQLTHLGVQPTLSGDMKVSWEVTSGNSTVKYDIKVLKDGKLYLFKRDESSSELNLADLANGEYQVTIIARDAQGRMLSEKVQSFTIDNPPTPKNVSVSGGLSDITLSWDFVDEATQTEIWASSTNNLANAERIAKVTANIYTHNVGPRQTRYYWLRHTRGINVGDWYQQQGLSAETGADIDAELALLNETLGQNIIDEVFDTAMPARKLEMIKTVARIDNPTENIGHKQLYNEADGKLYVWDGRKYTAKVQAVDLEGKLASSQLDQALINQLTTASSTADNALSKANTVQSALAQEATQRTQAIQAQTRARTQALQAEANARGTAVSRLEQADRKQAQLITTATTKADNALSGLSEERQARIAGDNAQAQARAILTTRVASVQSGISTLQNSIASANRSVSELSQSLNAKIDGIEVGGWNLIKNSRLLNNTTHWNVIGGRDVRNGIAVLKNLNTANWYWRQGFNLPKKQYTFSAEVKPERTAFYLHLYNGQKWVNFHARNLTPGIWQKISITFVSAITNISFINPGEGLVELQNPMLVEGNRAMTWAPAPEDIEQSISAVSAELTSYKSTQATKEQAQATQISGLTTRLGNAESSLSTTSQAITTLNGTVSTMHTIQAVSIAGNRKALAGISLGSNGGTESSVIVMADKFNVVKNAQDGNITPMFGVVNNKVAVNGDLIADGTISARMMAADSVQAGTIQAGAINANHLQAGQISADKLAIGLGGNLLYNPIFANNGNGWTYYVNTNNIENNGYAFNNETGAYRSGAYLPTENQFRLQRSRKSITGDARLGGLYQNIKLTPNTYYCFSAYVGAHRGYVDLNIELGRVQVISKSWSGRGHTGGYPNNTIDTGIENSYRIWILFKTNATNSAETTYRLIINTWGQNGQDSPMFVIRRPMLEECTEYTTQPSAWVNSGVTAIHGGSIVTNTITAQQIAGGTITGHNIAGGTITGHNISGGTITGHNISGGTITADKLRVTKLSALSSELGEITGGSININNRFKVNTSGQVEMRSATANVGMVINNDQIVVYDEQGRVRVKIGRL
ncbi:phage tail protein/putative Fels-1 prophage host specificity protein [Glaesserella parasuis ZJ0906]|uniref:Phage tail protein/putative Fels-1 prophage host specificity protein n=4 Tax=Glaesserella parasuis TaxID=738 RepID=A0A806JD73_GLAPU|nr:phage tail protein/putative Fels-1 prophage host specificity protein [Glaesserella parasuis ZJ0906]MDD2164280.1 phage tail protein [Glaesserella parasuis]MDP0379551.1 phage tail protein [Glaesserella parasuis]MDP0402121.1 phage tail protein [Glaesserella parasuis]